MRLLIFFVAIALAVGAFFATLQFTGKQQAANNASIVQEPRIIEKEQPKVKVFVARQDIPIGEAIKRTMLDIADYQQNLVLPDMATVEDTGTSPVDGMISRSPIVKGEVIMKGKFANPKDPSFMAGALGEGMRLVTVAVDAISGGGGFVYPGDRVDILITRELPGAQGTSLRTPVSEIFLSNVRVLAVNQRTASQAGEGPMLPSNVSLEVSTLDAERIRLSEGGHGRLSLVLRALKDKDSAFVPRPVGLGDLSRITPAAYFPTLYDNINSYTPKIITTPPGGDKAGEASVSSSNSVAGTSEVPSIDLIRGVKKESVQPLIPF